VKTDASPKTKIHCTACGDEIAPGTKYLVVYSIYGGFQLFEGCEHNEEKIQGMLRTLGRPPLGIAGSMSCLGEILMKYSEDCKNHGGN
jgi:hypothetical protein